MKNKHKKIVDFITEQNRLIRTGGLPKDHPDGKLEPCDVMLSSEEKRYWEGQEQLYRDMINKLHEE